MAKKRKYDVQPIDVPELGQVDREILTKTVDDGVYPLAMAKEIRLNRIKPDPDQPRTDYDEESLQGLAVSIEQQGVLNPISVQYMRQGDYFMIIHGERRWRAAKMAGLETVPAIVRDVDIEERLVQQLIENVQREDLNPVDRGKALKRLREELELNSWKAVGEKIGVSRVRVHQLLATIQFPPEIQEDLRAGNLSEKRSRVYTGLPVHHQLALHRARKEKDLTDEQVDQISRLLKKNKEEQASEIIQRVSAREEKVTEEPSSTPERKRPDARIQSLTRLSDRLERVLSTLTIDELSEDERNEFENALRSLQALVEVLLTRLDDG